MAGRQEKGAVIMIFILVESSLSVLVTFFCSFLHWDSWRNEELATHSDKKKKKKKRHA